MIDETRMGYVRAIESAADEETMIGAAMELRTLAKVMTKLRDQAMRGAKIKGDL